MEQWKAYLEALSSKRRFREAEARPQSAAPWAWRWEKWLESDRRKKEIRPMGAGSEGMSFAA